MTYSKYRSKKCVVDGKYIQYTKAIEKTSLHKGSDVVDRVFQDQSFPPNGWMQ